MLKLAIDLTGGCTSSPGNTDVIQVVVERGVMKAEQLPLLAHALQETRETRGSDGLREAALAAILFEFCRNRYVRARMIRHALKHHGVKRAVAKRDLLELRGECAGLLKGIGALPWGES
jgi:hypothetical protein